MSGAPPVQLGRRIVVWGATGSGKTTLARRLGEALGLGVIELDAIRHARGWDSVPWDEFRSTLTARLDADETWVVDGSYSLISHEYLSRADTVLWLHLPWRISFWRLSKRTVARAWTREPLYNPSGPRESWRLTFLSRRSILWWSVSHHRRGVYLIRQRLAGLRPEVRVYELRTGHEVDALIDAVTSRVAT